MYKTGDKVRAFGVDGVVTISTKKADSDYPVIVDFETGYTLSFTLDGKHYTWHKEPSLALIERAEKFEEVVGYVAVHKSLVSLSTYTGTFIYETKEEALALPITVGYQEIKYFRKVE